MKRKKPSSKRGARSVCGVARGDVDYGATCGDASAAFCTMELIAMAQKRDYKKLSELSTSAVLAVSKMQVPVKGWRAHLPLWIRKQKKAGDRDIYT